MNKNNNERRVYLVEYNDRNDHEIVFAANTKDLISRLKYKNWASFMDITEEYGQSR